MNYTVNVKNNKIFGIVDGKDYSIERTDKLECLFYEFLNKYNNCETLEDVKVLLSDVKKEIKKSRYDDIAEHLAYSPDDFKLYLKSSTNTSDFAIPQPLAELIISRISEKKDYLCLVKFWIRLLNSSMFLYENAVKICDIFDYLNTESVGINMDTVVVRSKHFNITKSGVLIISTRGPEDIYIKPISCDSNFLNSIYIKRADSLHSAYVYPEGIVGFTSGQYLNIVSYKNLPDVELNKITIFSDSVAYDFKITDKVINSAIDNSEWADSTNKRKEKYNIYRIINANNYELIDNYEKRRLLKIRLRKNEVILNERQEILGVTI